ncbi:hypothetical protein D3C72_641020 [compost metagenome]
MPTPMPTATKATIREFCAPAMIMDNTSRPKWSVPNGWAAEGAVSLAAMSTASTS